MARALHGEWSSLRRQAWHHADWLDAPQRIGAALAPLIGAPAEDVIAVDNTTLNIHKLLAYGLQLAAPDAKRRFIVYEPEGFPTDAHVVQGIVHHGGGRWAERAIDSPDELAGALRDDVAMVVLAHVDYRSSYRWDLAGATGRRARGRRARAVGPVAQRRRGAGRAGRAAAPTSPSSAATSTCRRGRARRRWPTSAATCRTATGPPCPAGSAMPTA